MVFVVMFITTLHQKSLVENHESLVFRFLFLGVFCVFLPGSWDPNEPQVTYSDW